MNYESRLNLSYYKELTTINDAHRILLVQHIDTGKIYIKKVLSVYNAAVFQQLYENPVPGIPRIYCLHEEAGELTLIEEYISGSTLSEILEEKGALSEDQTAGYVRELCLILNRLYEKTPPIIHRDIKPSNVIITPEDHVVLLDLNAARSGLHREEDTVLLGTKGYAAPEQYGFGSSNIQTDIYAVGMLMNTLLWGSFHTEIYPNSRLTPILERCTKMDPQQRYKNILQLYDSLQKVQGTGDALPQASFKRFLPPGFRTGTLWHMLVALPTYIFLAWVCLNLQVKNASGAALVFERGFSLLIFLAVIACSANYLDIWNSIPLCSSRNRFVKLLGILLLDAGVFIGMFVVMVVIVAVVFQ